MGADDRIPGFLNEMKGTCFIGDRPREAASEARIVVNGSSRLHEAMLQLGFKAVRMNAGGYCLNAGGTDDDAQREADSPGRH